MRISRDTIETIIANTRAVLETEQQGDAELAGNAMYAPIAGHEDEHPMAVRRQYQGNLKHQEDLLKSILEKMDERGVDCVEIDEITLLFSSLPFGTQRSLADTYIVQSIQSFGRKALHQ